MVTMLNDIDSAMEGVFGDRNTPKIAPKWVTSMGNWNRPPTPIRKAGADDFFNLLRHQTPTHVEHRQILRECCDITEFDGSYADVKIFWFSTCAIMIQFSNEWTLDENKNVKYIKEPIYFKVGCQHNYIEMSQKDARNQGIYHGGTCYYVSKCSKCGDVIACDSSD